MRERTDVEFRKQIKQKNLNGIYVLYGDEKYLILKDVERVIAMAEACGYADFNLQRFNSDCTISQLIDSADALPFFAEKKYIILNDWNADSLSSDELKTVTGLFSELQESTVIVIYLPNVALGKKLSAKWKKLAELDNVTWIEYTQKTGAELEKYLVAYAEKLGCTMSRDDAARIVRYSGGTLESLIQEVSKVCAYSGGGVITKEHIEAVVTKNREAQVFSLSKALISGKYEEAYNIIDILIQQREEPVGIIALLSSSYINLYRVKCFLEAGVPVRELGNYYNYKGRDFLLKNAERDCARFSMPVIQKSIALLLEADYALKGGAGSGQANVKRVVLDELIAKLLLAAQED